MTVPRIFAGLNSIILFIKLAKESSGPKKYVREKNIVAVIILSCLSSRYFLIIGTIEALEADSFIIITSVDCLFITTL